MLCFSDEGDSEMLRNKRNLTATSNDVSSSETRTSSSPTTTTTMNIASQEVPTTLSAGSTTTTVTATKAVTGNTTVHKSLFGQATHPTTTQSPDDYDPDFHLGNVVMDAVFNHAEGSDMKQTLGLCRKNAEIKMPQFKATLFPGEQAADILNCINDILRNQTKKQICLHLDAEMSAYLKWLVLTGESKERHKPVKIASKEDFLFPSSCVSEQSAITPECLVEPVVRENFEEWRVSWLQIDYITNLFL